MWTIPKPLQAENPAETSTNLDDTSLPNHSPKGGGSESESDHEQDKPLPADYPRKSISQPAGKSCITFRKSYSDIQPYFLNYIMIRLEDIHFTKCCMKFIQNYK